MNMADRIVALEQELAASRQTNRDWLRVNAPGGWVDDLRVRVKTLEAALRGLCLCGKPECGAEDKYQRDRVRATLEAQAPPYPWCKQPGVCRGSCPLDPSCGE